MTRSPCVRSSMRQLASRGGLTRALQANQHQHAWAWTAQVQPFGTPSVAISSSLTILMTC